MREDYQKGDFTISTDQTKLDLKCVHSFLKQTYWAKHLPYDVVEDSVENSLCFGVYHHTKQIGFARVVTDFSTIVYLLDVFILEDYNNKELSEWLMECIWSHPRLQKLKNWLLAKKGGLYAPFRFTPVKYPESVTESRSS